MMDGSLWGLPQFGWPLVDVRDIADLHYRAMLAEGIAGERFIGAGPFLWTADIARVLKTKLGAKAKGVPSLILPNFLVRLAGLFDPIIRSHLWELGKFRPVSAEKAKRVLGWSPRPCEETILATAESLIAEGLV